jgi:hypothetical protein
VLGKRVKRKFSDSDGEPKTEETKNDKKSPLKVENLEEVMIEGKSPNKKSEEFKEISLEIEGLKKDLKSETCNNKV